MSGESFYEHEADRSISTGRDIESDDQRFGGVTPRPLPSPMAIDHDDDLVSVRTFPHPSPQHVANGCVTRLVLWCSYLFHCRRQHGSKSFHA